MAIAIYCQFAKWNVPRVHRTIISALSPIGISSPSKPGPTLLPLHPLPSPSPSPVPQRVALERRPVKQRGKCEADGTRGLMVLKRWSWRHRRPIHRRPVVVPEESGGGGWLPGIRVSDRQPFNFNYYNILQIYIYIFIYLYNDGAGMIREYLKIIFRDGHNDLAARFI